MGTRLEASPFSRKELEQGILETTLVAEKEQLWKDALMALEPYEIAMMVKNLSNKDQNLGYSGGPLYAAFKQCKGLMSVERMKDIIAEIKHEDAKFEKIAGNLIDALINRRVVSLLSAPSRRIDETRELISEILEESHDGLQNNAVQENLKADRDYYEKYTTGYRNFYVDKISTKETEIAKRMRRLSGTELRQLDEALHRTTYGLGGLLALSEEHTQVMAIDAIDQYLRNQSDENQKRLETLVESE